MLSEQDIIREQGGKFYKVINKKGDILLQKQDFMVVLVEMCPFSNNLRL